MTTEVPAPRSAVVALKLKGQGKDGRFMEFEDKLGRVRVKIHPPDKSTSYHHVHLYDSKGRSLDSNLASVFYKSPDAHIEVQSIEGKILENKMRY